MKGDFFHILNRGVEKRKICFSNEDYPRFVYGLYDFNDVDNVLPYPQRSKLRSFGHRMSKIELVDLLCWCLMPNHSHNLVQEKIDGGASVFSKKIFGGYTKYINEKCDRDGVLFQGRSKIILVRRDAHFLHLPFYIMANPIDLIESGWREKGIENFQKVISYLETYRWSSFPDLIGEENFPLLINKELFYKIFETNEKQFKKDFIEWLKGHRMGFGSGEFID